MPLTVDEDDGNILSILTFKIDVLQNIEFGECRVNTAVRECLSRSADDGSRLVTQVTLGLADEGDVYGSHRQ